MAPDPIDALIDELRDAVSRLSTLSGSVDELALVTRPSAEEWSAAECIEHLNLTTRAYLPLLQAAVESLRHGGAFAKRPPRRDFVGWMLCRVIEPPARQRSRTAAAFIPDASPVVEHVVNDFRELQDALIALVAGARDLALDRARVQSPFDSRMRYNAWSAFKILAAHQRRHLAQAVRAIERLKKGDA
ncbi:MAG: DinB family protein [Thermoanaerobaculia bacterium]